MDVEDGHTAGFSEEQRREFRDAHKRQRLETLLEDMQSLRASVREQVERITDDSEDVGVERARKIADLIRETRSDLQACEDRIRQRLADAGP